MSTVRALTATGALDFVHQLGERSMTTAPPPPVLIFDGDDTLWRTEPLYDRARRRARAVVEEEGLDGAGWEALQRSIDVANVARFGLTRTRFPTSCREAYEQLCQERGETPSPAVAEKVEATAAAVFDDRAPRVRGVVKVLRELARRHRLVLVTQGDPDVQERRVEASGLRSYFDRVVIVAEKTPAVLAQVLRSAAVEPEQAWMIGNSIPSDIRPALRLGMRAVWVDAHVWEHERREAARRHPRMVQARRLADVPAAIAAHTGAPPEPLVPVG
jgi:putative hydrolase of the HAD superfamily